MFCSLLLIVYAVYRIYLPINSLGLPSQVLRNYYTLIMVLGGIAIICFALALRLNTLLKVNLAVTIVSITITLYAVETYLEYAERLHGKLAEPKNTYELQRQQQANKLGISYDKRRKFEVFKDLKLSGVTVYPTAYPLLYISQNGFSSNTTNIFPLGGISNSTTVGINESGYFPILKTDEHGFNNPKHLYKKDELDIALVGDSFAGGDQVQLHETIAGVLRQHGFKTLSFGIGGTGSLIHLAQLKEYVELLQPKIVLWLYWSNDDIKDMAYEMKSPLLMRYLDDDQFSQHLMSRQQEIDNVLIKYADNQYSTRLVEKNKAKEKFRTLPGTRILKLYNLRSKIGLQPTTKPTQSSHQLYRQTFIKILSTANQVVSRWSGQFYFLYLPGMRHKLDSNREFVLKVATDLGISVVDVQKLIFDPHPDPRSLFGLRLGPHYNSTGYRLIAETIVKTLKANGFHPHLAKN